MLQVPDSFSCPPAEKRLAGGASRARSSSSLSTCRAFSVLPNLAHTWLACGPRNKEHRLHHTLQYIHDALPCHTERQALDPCAGQASLSLAFKQPSLEGFTSA